MTAGRKCGAALRALRGGAGRGGALEIVARGLAVTAADGGGWRDAPLGGGRATTATRGSPGRAPRGASGRWTPGGSRPGSTGCRPAAGAPFAARRPARRAPSSRSPRAAATAQPASGASAASAGSGASGASGASAGSGASRARASTGCAGRPRLPLRRDSGRDLRARCRTTGPAGPMPAGARVEAARRALADSPHGPRGEARPWPRWGRASAPNARSGRACATAACAPPRERVRRARRDIRPRDGCPILLAARQRPVGGEPGGPASRSRPPRRPDRPRAGSTPWGAPAGPPPSPPSALGSPSSPSTTARPSAQASTPPARRTARGARADPAGHPRARRRRRRGRRPGPRGPPRPRLAAHAPRRPARARPGLGATPSPALLRVPEGSGCGPSASSGP